MRPFPFDVMLRFADNVHGNTHVPWKDGVFNQSHLVLALLCNNLRVFLSGGINSNIKTWLFHNVNLCI